MNAFTKLNFLKGAKKIPQIYQSELSECGLACLAMVANYHEQPVSISGLRHLTKTSLSGTTLKELAKIAEHIGFDSRALSLSLEEVSQLQTPCILHWNFDHFVVLRGVKRGYYYLNDPSDGERKITKKEFSKAFTGIALELTPKEMFKKISKEKPLRIKDLLFGLSGLKTAVTKLLVLTLGFQIVSLASPLFMQMVVDDVVSFNDKQMLKQLSIGFALVLAVLVFVGILRRQLVIYMAAQLNLHMLNKLLGHLIHLPLDFFQKRHVGDIMSRFGSLAEIREFITTGIVSISLDGILSALTLSMMLLYSPALTGVVIFVTLIFVAIRIIFFKYIKTLNEVHIRADAVEQSHFIETIRCMQCIKLFGAEKKRMNIWQNYLVDSLNAETKLGQSDVSFEYTQTLLKGLEHIVIIFMAAQMVIDNQISIGMMFAFVTYRAQFSETISQLIVNTVNLKMLKIHLERIADIVRAPVENFKAQGNVNISDTNLTVSNVNFRYSIDSNEVLNNVHLFVAPGECVGIVGPSGSGKTTLLKIMLGLLKPDHGNIRIGRHDIEEVGLNNYRNEVACVMQDDQLLSGTIAENIAFFETDMDINVVMECAKKASIHAEILAMPMGYQSIVGDMGSTLSGGQRQRLMIARALYKKPKILFMDEATSHLDVMTERAVNECLINLGITRIIIAHRQQTIDLCERVLQLTDKTLKECN
jgi:ATP-binding cassette, subfamily B, bacterial CvaB/MchF/RaxB